MVIRDTLDFKNNMQSQNKGKIHLCLTKNRCVSSGEQKLYNKIRIKLGSAIAFKGNDRPKESKIAIVRLVKKININEERVDRKEEKINTDCLTRLVIKLDSSTRLKLRQSTSIKIISNLNQLTKEIIKELESSQIYSCYLDVTLILQIIEFTRLYFINHEQMCQILRMVLNYMHLCQKGASGMNENEIEEFVRQMAQKWVKLKYEILFVNKDSLKILDYLVKSTQDGIRRSNHSYLGIDFDFSVEQVRKVAKVTKQLCRYDLRAFFYLSNYLMKSSLLMENNSVPMEQIQQKLTNILTFLSKENPPASPLKAETNLIQFHKNFQLGKVQLPTKTLNLKQIEKEKRVQKLEEFIVARAEEAKQSYTKFIDLVKDICLEQGYHFLAGMKIKDKYDKKSIERVKQKMLKERFQKYSLDKYRSQPNQNTMRDFVKRQYQNYLRQIRQLYDLIEGPIEFRVSDLLRAKCMFSDVSKINQCCSKLLNKIEQKGYLLINIDNRLLKNTADLVLNVKIGETITELQLAIDFKVVENEFNHKIYELLRSKFFTPLTMLARFNEDLTFDFVKLQQLIIEVNLTHNTIYNEKEKMDFRLIEPYFNQLVQSLPVSFRSDQSHKLQVKFDMLQQPIKQLEELTQQRQISQSSKDETECVDKHLNNGCFWHELKEYEKAAHEFDASLQQSKQGFSRAKSNENGNRSQNQIQLTMIYLKRCRLLANTYKEAAQYFKSLSIYEEMLNITNQIQEDDIIQNKFRSLQEIAFLKQQLGRKQEAIAIYKQCLKLILKLRGDKNNLDSYKVLINIGNVYKEEGKYLEALAYYNQLLQILACLPSNHQFNYFYAYNCLGVINFYLGKYADSIKFYQKSLDVYSAFRGRESAQYADALGNMALVYQKKLDYEYAQSNYCRCLQIVEAIKGKNSLEYTAILNNLGLLHYEQAHYDQSLTFYQQCLEIYQQKKGGESTECGEIHNNIGAIYYDICQYEKAVEQFEIFLRIQESLHSDNNLFIALIKNNIGATLIQTQSYEKSEAYFEEVEKLLSSLSQRPVFLLIQLYKNVGNLYLKTHRFDKSLQFLQKSLHLCEQLHGMESTQSIMILYLLGNLIRQMNEFDNAIRFYDSMVTLIKKYQGDESVDYIYSSFGLGAAYFAMEMWEEAMRYNQMCTQSCEKHGKLFEEYGESCYRLGRMEEQRQHYLQAVKFYELATGGLEKCKRRRLTQVEARKVNCEERSRESASNWNTKRNLD